jgi:hypothetical protein
MRWFRSSHRDSDADLAALASLQRHIAQILDAIAREEHGLALRLEQCREQCSVLLGSGDGTEYMRDESDERQLRAAERELTAAAGRIRQLRANQAFYRDLLCKAETAPFDLRVATPSSRD